MLKVCRYSWCVINFAVVRMSRLLVRVCRTFFHFLVVSFLRFISVHSKSLSRMRKKVVKFKPFERESFMALELHRKYKSHLKINWWRWRSKKKDDLISFNFQNMRKKYSAHRIFSIQDGTYLVIISLGADYLRKNNEVLKMII